MSSDKHVGSFMLEKGVCDLLLAPLVRSSNFRVREVSLGIIANLMCHKASAKVLFSVCFYVNTNHVLN